MSQELSQVVRNQEGTQCSHHCLLHTLELHFDQVLRQGLVQQESEKERQRSGLSSQNDEQFISTSFTPFP